MNAPEGMEMPIEGSTGPDAGPAAGRGPARVFISFAMADEPHLREMEKHLALLRRQGVIDTWHGRMIDAGDDWERRIDEKLDEADLVLLLVSADFMASSYFEREMARALERHRAGTARVVPVFVRTYDWSGAPFASLQGLPRYGNPVTRWSAPTRRGPVWRPGCAPSSSPDRRRERTRREPHSILRCASICRFGASSSGACRMATFTGRVRSSMARRGERLRVARRGPERPAAAGVTNPLDGHIPPNSPSLA